MTKLSNKIVKIANLTLEAGQPALFKRLIRVSRFLYAKADTASQLHDGIEEEREDEPPIEEVDTDSSDKTYIDSTDNDEADDEDVEGFAGGMPMGALPHKERRRGPHPKDVQLGKPDWWNHSF